MWTILSKPDVATTVTFGIKSFHLNVLKWNTAVNFPWISRTSSVNFEKKFWKYAKIQSKLEFWHIFRNPPWNIIFSPWTRLIQSVTTYCQFGHVICICRWFCFLPLNRTIWRWDMAEKNHFQDGVRPPSWICCDVSILHPETAFLRFWHCVKF